GGADRGRYCGSQAKATVWLSHGLDLSAHRREPLRKPAEAIPSRRLRHAPAVVDDVDLDMGGISPERDPASLSARMPDHIGRGLANHPAQDSLGLAAERPHVLLDVDLDPARLERDSGGRQLGG